MISTGNYNPVCRGLEEQAELSSGCSALPGDSGKASRGGEIRKVLSKMFLDRREGRKWGRRAQEAAMAES